MKAKAKISALVLGTALTLAIGAGITNAASVDCTEPTATDAGSLTPGFTNLDFGVVYCGNDPFSGQGGYINGTPSLAKINIDDNGEGVPSTVGSAEDGIAPGDQSDAFSLSNLIFSGEDLVGGTWTFTPQMGELSPTIMVIKAGSAFVLYSVADLLTGSFTTDLLEGKNLSHISWYDTGDGDGGGGGSAVPIPGALPLMMTGIAGLGYLARSRRKQRAKT